MRLYEATGVGALLLTDNQLDLSDLFEPGKEVATYDSIPDCVDRISRLLADASLREQIAHAGQARTLSAHTYHNRCAQLLHIFER